MKYRVYMVYRLAADGATIAARNVLRTLTGTTMETFQPLQERLVAEIEVEEHLELDEEKVRNLLRTQAPNASGMRLEPVETSAEENPLTLTPQDIKNLKEQEEDRL